MKKSLKFVIAAAIAACAMSFSPSATMARPLNPNIGPVIPGHVIVTIKATSPDEAKKFARGIEGFVLDEQYGPIDQHNGQYIVRGMRNDHMWDPSGHMVVVVPDTLSSPTGSTGSGKTNPVVVDPALRNAKPMPLPTAN